VQSEEKLDVEKAHLITHAKVYAIAEKYVSPFVTVSFLSFCLITDPWFAELLSSAPADLLSMAAMSCLARRFEHRQAPRFASPA
jgi:hypothetical protein